MSSKTTLAQTIRSTHTTLKESAITTSSSITNSMRASSTLSSTSSYNGTYTAGVPVYQDPFILHCENVRGTVFISVGSIIISVFIIVIIARLFFWMKNRKDAKYVTKFDEDYYNGPLGDIKLGFNDNNSSFMSYDTKFFEEKRNTSGLNSPYSTFNNTPNSNDVSAYTHSSTPSTSSSNNLLLNANQVSQPGRNLRNALTQEYNPNRNTNRMSFISPINELINSSVDLQEPNNNKVLSSNLNMNLSSPSVTIETEHNTPIVDNNKTMRPHSRCTSVDLNELEKMIDQSLVSVNNVPLNEHKLDKNGKRKRAPSVILDSLIQDDI